MPHFRQWRGSDGYLSRLGAQTMARFFVCMLVVLLKVARRERCLMRNSSVLEIYNQASSHFLCQVMEAHVGHSESVASPATSRGRNVGFSALVV